MTRGEMVNLSDRLLVAAFGTRWADDPITTIEPLGLLDIAADTVCRKTDCFYDVQDTDLVAGVSTYSAPTIYRVKEIYCIDVGGNTNELLARTPAQMTREFGAAWRDWQSQDPPMYLIWEGATKVRLAPTPSVNRAGALFWEGFAVTTSKVTGSTAHLWPGENDQCPLPEDAQMAAVYKLCMLRCLPFVGRQDMPDAAAKKAAFDDQYRDERNMLERDAAKRYVARRVGPGHRQFTIAYL